MSLTLREMVGKLESLRVLEVDANRISGTMPPWLTRRLPRLSTLNLNTNSLSGTLPPDIGSLTSLSRLTASATSLSGSLPPQLGRLAQLELLTLEISLKPAKLLVHRHALGALERHGPARA